MSLSRRGRVLAAVAAALLLTAGIAEARSGRGGSFGSRGTRTHSAPAPTNTAPTAAPIQRSTTPQAAPNAGPRAAQPNAAAAQRRPGFFGGGFGGALMGGLLGAGLFGLLSGSGLFGGMSGFGSFLGLLLQIGLIVLLVRFAIGWFRRRQEATAGGPQNYARQGGPAAGGRSGLSGLGLGGAAGAGAAAGSRPQAAASQPINIADADYAAFERLLYQTQDAYSREDFSALRRFATPEVASYFTEELTDNASKGVVNRVSDVNFLQGDLAEAWSEGNTEYATVAMKFSLRDTTFDRATNAVVDGDPSTPITVTEIWTFRRARGGEWLVSAIQQA
ncbi:TIM44-like domain-containing protein [Pseudochelatococcus contaminans]|uniref:Putative lipid-binding transport protein (Tim44 family) n=1 Tax=Pseudochelatococcus contaminans TaxID=1538103 RepID=A0A7W5Z3A2_9HYPH|nr:TIM44-like domain-containing protein [Pseudochelatococcus contaminans]MBB3809351.1 putative lipid-binding transport protein (Tim44 family) [Pseudochelatococcus contaminans]